MIEMETVGQIVCLSLSLITLGAALVFHLFFLILGRNAMLSSGERTFAMLPGTLLFAVAIFFGWLALVESSWFYN